MFQITAWFKTVTIIITFTIITNVIEPLAACQEPNEKRILAENAKGMLEKRNRQLPSGLNFLKSMSRLCGVVKADFIQIIEVSLAPL